VNLINASMGELIQVLTDEIEENGVFSERPVETDRSWPTSAIQNSFASHRIISMAAWIEDDASPPQRIEDTVHLRRQSRPQRQSFASGRNGAATWRCRDPSEQGHAVDGRR
jgi:hypothetical protein